MEKNPNWLILKHNFEQKNYLKCYQEAEKIIAQFPRFDFAYHCAAVSLFYLNELKQSEYYFQQALLINPNDIDCIKNYIQLLLKLKKNKDALIYYEKLLSFNLNPDEKSAIYLKMADLTSQMKNNFQAMQFLAQAVQLTPEKPLVLANFASALAVCLEIEKAEEILNLAESLTQLPIEKSYILNIKIILSSYFLNNSPEKIKKIALDYYHQQPYKPLFHHPKNPCPKRLKVGLISGDFNNHSVSLFLVKWLEYAPNTALDFYAYSNRNFEDSTTEKLKPFFKKFTPIFHLNDEEVAKTIFQDGIHILGDLSGHSLYHRLNVFTFRPAPVSFTAIGWMGTTGTPGMDYILADPICVPPGSEHEFTEKVMRLPQVFQPYSFHTPFPPVNALPFSKNGFFTFGAFCTPHKVNRKTIALWSQALKTIAHSRFIYAHAECQEKALCEHFYALFQEQGIDPNRITLVGNPTREEYLNLHHQVDFILDAFPVTSGTTAAESLLMGVPTLTLLGNTRGGRLCASFLNAVGLTEWICPNEDAFFKRLTQICQTEPQTHALRNLRQTLREKALHCPLTDCATFIHHLEKAFFQMYADFTSGKLDFLHAQ